MEQDITRLKKLLEHWIEHNVSHAQSYREWASKAQQANLEGVAQELYQVAELTEKINHHFTRAKDLLA